MIILQQAHIVTVQFDLSPLELEHFNSRVAPAFLYLS